MIALPWAKIVDIAMFKFNSALSFTRKTPMKVARAPLARCTPPSCVVHCRIAIMEFNHSPNFHIARSKFPEIRGFAYCTRVARAHCTITPQVMHHRIAFVEQYQCTKFRVPSLKFLESKVPREIHSARAMHVHYVPYHQMACTIELRALNSISAPNLVSIAENFLEPEDPSQINFSGPGARSLHLTGTVTTKAYMLGKRTFDLQLDISGAYRLACRGGRTTTDAKKNCTCTARAQCTPAPFFIRRQVGLAKVHPCTEFDVASSKFP